MADVVEVFPVTIYIPTSAFMYNKLSCHVRNLIRNGMFSVDLRFQTTQRSEYPVESPNFNLVLLKISTGNLHPLELIGILQFRPINLIF